jgi:hypothetical protein
VTLLGDPISKAIYFCDKLIVEQKPRFMPTTSVSERRQLEETLITVSHKPEPHNAHDRRLLLCAAGYLATRRRYRHHQLMLHVDGFLANPKTCSYRGRAEMRSSVWISSAPLCSGRKRTSSERSEEPEVSSAVLYNALHFAAFCSLSRDICSQTIK